MMVFGYFVIGLLTISLSLGLECPVKECTCKNKIINCRNKGLTSIPEITPSSRYREITFENSVDPTEKIHSNNPKLNKISILHANAFKGLKVEKINLGKAGVREVRDGAFSGLETSLKDLVLGGAHVNQPPLYSLEGLEKLKRLELQNFVLNTLKKSLFAIDNLFRLESLKLINMKTHFVLEDSLEDFKNLKHLEISGNPNLKFYPASAIWRVKSLQELVFKNDGIVKVPGWAFYDLPNLKLLDLSRNEIRTIRPGAFKNVSATLEKLDLTGNALTTDSLQTFTTYDWKNLRNLRILYNKITGLPDNMFSKMEKLESLEMQLNALRRLTSNDLTPLTNLKHLDLSDNLITEIQADALNLPALQTLRLLNLNTVKSVVSINNAFGGVKGALVKVDMKENNFRGNELWGEIAHLTNVTELDISETGLNELPKSAFINNKQIQKLGMSKNNLGPSLSADQLNGLQGSLEQLRLNNNRLQSLDNCIFEKQFPKLKLVTLYGNPLKCDCALGGLQKWLKGRPFFFSYIVQAVCASPTSEVGKNLRKATLKDDQRGTCTNKPYCA
ncbi:slit homolog 2 protein-like [Ostrea edulis]|uniref:slit homolog 2 protein-like n=1 Tax=Ostrea edulis TaxID=37623 RepID=UPI0024AF2C25|nr:slit homolog 2 protein-like [Ostrea edulis]XP_048749081.2 slit homolog 2 protein-like [Ostrea edulis]XP_048749090.2 slit homolog 2 protein-like [Ostrea edulis]XP_048749098.2 slit homolog 2 protein-like [Ostrea edulis]XP_048749103.2 slit homolog 2 protein-like [Ostrea edulis]XP_056008723.1 slit homolog 2 protein-like [Ostrea edulis]